MWDVTWLVVAASIALSIYAIVRRSWRLMLISGLLYSPFVWYLGCTPRFAEAPMFLIFHVAAALALLIDRHRLAWVLLTPVLALTVSVAVLVII